tara:strand:+ start:78 stop:1733 length:1656 start_codon:yes stop_codon:yes gene_type:complete
MKNKFIILCCSYNNEEWAETHLESILEQTYTNYEVIYVNDASTDNTLQIVTDLVGNDSRFHIINNKKNLDSPTNYIKHPYEFMDGRDENEILVELCGDDWFATPTVLEQLNQTYNETDCWLTYGGMRVWNGGTEIVMPNPQNSDYDPFVHKHALYRKDMWRAGHLHSFRWFVHKQFKVENAISNIDNEIYKHAIDLQLQFSMMEMVPSEKIVNLQYPTVMFNNDPDRVRPLKDGSFRDSKENEKYEIEIRNRKKFKRVAVREELSGEKLPQVNAFGDYRERHTIPKDFSYTYNLSKGEFDLTVLQDDSILKYLNGSIEVDEDKPIVAVIAEGPHLFNQELLYDTIQTEYGKFDRVLGWHESLHNLPNFKFKPITEISQWNLLPIELDTTQFQVYKKSKKTSFITSKKSMVKGHEFRLECLAEMQKQRLNVDAFGRDINPIASKLEGLKDYEFSIAMENAKMKNYFTEKLLDCMLAGVIPIYHGCPNIQQWFNPDGIITFDTTKELVTIIQDLEKTPIYESKKAAIQENYERALDWYEDNDKFYNKYLKDLV